MEKNHGKALRAAGCLLALLLALAAPAVPGHVTAAQAAAPAPPTCNDPRDLIVSRGPVVLRGTQSFDRVCVRDGGTLTVHGALTLHTSILYIAPDSAISANGAEGHYWATHDCIGNDVQPDGQPGGALAIVARHAIILGRISADGGRGLDYAPYCGGDEEMGHGGAAGSVTLTALDLTFGGRVTARGGAGGDATAATGAGPTSASSGAGGAGGQITLALGQPASAALRPFLDVRGGAPGAPGHGPTGAPGPAGTVFMRALSASERAGLPTEPSSPIMVIGAGPARLPLAPALAQSPALRCGSGDLAVRAGATLTLSGLHQYAHVCVRNGGVLRGGASLTLIAHTIAVAPGGRIILDGASPLPFHWSRSGEYASRGACLATHAPPHAGLPGAAGGVGRTYTANPDLQANPGGGGGLLTLIAGTAVLDGQVSAAGGRGQKGISDPENGAFGPQAFQGGGGGSGGGIYVAAQQLQLGGTISVAGGEGGLGNGLDAAAGAHGSAGCITLFADLLAAPTSTLPVTGPAVLARPLPSDPVAPPAPAGGQYFARTLHTLSGLFLDFWRRHGGVAILGYPQSEPFGAGGYVAQYTDRFELELVHGRIQTVPLGRLFTAGRTFPRAAPVASTPNLLYVPATGHTLSGRFLTFWRAHDGAALLGAPISEVVLEGNGDGSGRLYRLQWFEKGRMEYHPELAGTRYAIELGLLGVQALQRRGWLAPPAANIAPLTPDSGGSPATHLYAVTRSGTFFGSDGSRRWHFLWSGPGFDVASGCASITALAVANAARTLYAGTCTGALWKSGDAGHTWAESDRGLPRRNLAVFDLAIAPDQNTLYAATVGGIYKSADAGATWLLALKPSEQAYETTSVALNPHNPRRVWAGTEGDGLYRSDDAGLHWTRLAGGGLPSHVWVSSISISPACSARVYVTTIKGLYRSEDGGATWAAVGGLLKEGLRDRIFLGSIYGVTFSPLQPRTIYVAAYGGIFVSHDGGATWTASTGITHGGYFIVVSQSHPGLAYVAANGMYRGTDGGLTWQPWSGGDLRAGDTVSLAAGNV